VLPCEPAPAAKRAAWWGLGTGGGAAAIVAVLLAGGWQQQLHLVMGADDPTQPAYLAVLLIATALFAALVAAGRGIRLAARLMGLRLRRWVPPRTAALTGATLVALLVTMMVQGVLVRGLLRAADTSFQAIDETIAEDVAAPTSPLVSGGPDSLAPWESLGTQGRNFIDRATDVAELESFHAEADAVAGEEGPLEPIRVYTGLQTEEDVRRRAEIAVAELERTGAFDRAVLCVAAATGTGWVNPVAASALEYLHAGDTAIVSMQYSYLPSWLSFLADRERASEAGEVLFTAVHERWSELPAGDRPELVVYGESLGSYATESAFDGIADLRERTDGALLVGAPHFNPLRGELTRRRDPDSPQRLPVVDGGRTVRFGAVPEDLARPAGAWPRPRVVYLQQPSDPVVWWSPRLAYREPDWLREPRGEDVLQRMRWYPVVTFWQLSADLVHADDVPAGHGHDYGTKLVDGWRAVTAPEGWETADVERLRRRLR
jgi:uncharacterized membrane protein